LAPGARRHLAWLAAWTFAGLFALVGAPVAGRVLPLPALGGAALVGNAIAVVWARLRPDAPALGTPPLPAAAPPASRWWWAALVPLAALHFAFSPLLRVGQALQQRQMAEHHRRIAEQADVGACARAGSLYLLTGADPVLALYAAPALAFYTPHQAGAERLRVLSMAPRDLSLERPEPRVLSIEVLGSGPRDNPFERLYRTPADPLRAGARVDLPELAVVVERAEDGVFQRARFEFRRALDDASCVVAWRGGRVVS